ncbi:TerD family protein [Sporosarcina sp. E16_8]|uniref:TerD family protein n=1 Tax=Sporosarcina sp. E16_8 TaxID=2789295 RepID=UPI001A92EA8D|nr:TerD family protein [Sporosarcina sp. E16_8]MBO0587811.1 TerD family protein [Sporosarcina sp. E16_8]
MAISLSKGQKVDLTKSNPGLTNITVGVGWDTNKYDGGKDFDLDSSVFLLNAAGVCADEKDFVFFNNLEGGNGSVVHTGDNLTGEGDGDDEQVKVSLSNVPTTVERIAFAITIHDAEERSQNFGQVSNSYVRIVNDANGEELIRYDLGEDFSIETAVVVGELYRHGSEWKFNAIGSGYQGGLGSLVKDYGLQS